MSSRDPDSSVTNMGGDERGEYGAIVSFESETGTRLTLHDTGAQAVAVRSMCVEALQRDPTFRVVAISTPSSIWTDITGRKMGAGGGQTVEKRPSTPEAALLGRAGAAIMLHPRLRGGANESARAWELVDKRGDAALAELLSEARR